MKLRSKTRIQIKQAQQVYMKRERERVDLFEILGSDAGEIETEAAMEEREKDCGDRGERRSKRHGVSF